MSTTTELAEVRRALARLRSAVSALRSRCGDGPAVRRLGNDLDRLDIDLADLTDVLPAPRRGSESYVGETVIVPDTPYDPSLWRGVDDEGVGGQQDNR